MGDWRDLAKRARNEILEEVVAFANAYGGALVLGMVESRGKQVMLALTSPAAAAM